MFSLHSPKQNRILAALGNPCEHVMLTNPAIVADRNRSRINETNAGAVAIAALQIGA